MKVKVVTLCSGYDSQCLALERIKREFSGFDYELVAWAEFDPESKQAIDSQPAVIAHNALFPQWSDRNLGDITTCDWGSIKGDIDLLCYSTPCFVAGTFVLTSGGYRCIEDIRVGDMVLTHSNRFCRVEEVGFKPSSDLYMVRGMMFDRITCTGNHPFFVRVKSREWDNSNRAYRRVFSDPRWVESKDLDRGAYLGYAINTRSELPAWEGSIDNRWGHSRRVNKLGEFLDKPMFWYVMGRYVGDGWKRTNQKYGSGIIICCSDRNYDSLVSALNEIGLHFSQVNERTGIKLHISMNELNAFVDRYGNYAYGKKIDAETMNLPVHLLSSFLDGIIDSDGCFTNNEYRVTSVSRELSYGLQQCIAKVYHCPVGMYKTIRPKTTVIEGRTVNQRDTYTLVWHPEKRKQDKAFYEDGYIWFPLKSIEKLQDTEVVYNMQVAEDHSYTANGAIVHNCQSISNAGLQHGFKEGSGTRSSIIWSVLDAIRTLRPKYLLMENVAAMVNKKFIGDFRLWQRAIEELGYTNYAQLLNAKDFGVPQNRNRIFMISVRNDISRPYIFPSPFPLELRLKDVLEDSVDEKYYLSDKMITYINSDGGKTQGFRGGKNITSGKDSIAACLTARYAKMSRQDNYIQEPLNPDSEGLCRTIKAQYYKNGRANFEEKGAYGATGVIQIANIVDDTNIGFKNPQRGRIYSAEGLSPCLNTCGGGGLEPKIITDEE